jgi:hypothetical protein
MNEKPELKNRYNRCARKSLSMITGSTTIGTLLPQLYLCIHEVLSTSCWLVVPSQEVSDNSEVIKVHTPSSPITKFSHIPSSIACQVLTASTTKRMCSIEVEVLANIQKIVSEVLHELLRGLYSRSLAQFRRTVKVPMPHYFPPT